MSVNQSRAEKGEPSQFRKSGRSGGSNQQRNFSGGGGKGGGGGTTAPPPSSSLSTNRSFNKKSNNAQGGQSRVSGASVNSDSSNASAARAVQNGAHSQSLRGAMDAPLSGVTVKQTDASTQKSTRGVPKPPSSNAAMAGSDTTVPTTPAKAPGDASRPFPLQFGSLSPGLMNGMQIPARTSSAPPNLDEQKRDQARNDSLRSTPALPMPTPTPTPTPTIPKQQLTRKDGGASDQSTTAVSKAKRDVQVSAVSPATTQIQKPSSVHPIPGISMQMPPFHQPHAPPVQFAGPSPQMQSQSMPMPMPLPRGNPSQQQVFVQGLQPHHPMQSQGIMHQGQTLNFSSQMGAPLPPQLGNIGINIASQFQQQQQAGQFGGPRKSIVKITHPDTHEELRLDKRGDPYTDGGSSGPTRPHPSLPSQSQPIPSFSSTHPANYYPNSYNASLFFPASSVPLSSSQLTTGSQTQRFYNQVTQGPPSVSFMNQPSRNSFPVGKTGSQLHGIVEPSNLERARDVHNIISPPLSTPVQVTVKPAASSHGEKAAYSSLSASAPTSVVDKGDTPKIPRAHEEASSIQPPTDSVIFSEISSKQSEFTSIPPVTNSLSAPSPAPIKDSVSVVISSTESASVNKSEDFSVSSSPQLKSTSLPVASKPSTSTSISVESPVTNTLPSASTALTKDSSSIATNVEGIRKETVNRSEYIKDEQKKSGKRGQFPSQKEGGGQSTVVSSSPSPGLELSSSFNGRARKTVEAKTTASSGTGVADLEDTRESLPASGVAAEHVSDSKNDSAVEFESSEVGGVETHVDTSLDNEQPKTEMLESKERERILLLEEIKENDSEITPESTLKSAEFVNQPVQNDILEGTTTNAVESLETAPEKLEEPVDCVRQDDRAGKSVDVLNAETSEASSSRSDHIGGEEVAATESGMLDQDSSLSDLTLRDDGESGEGNSSGLATKEKPLLEPNRAKGTTASAKKKRKVLLQKADAAGTTSDLYNAYKGPEEKKETATSADSTESIISKQVSDDVSREDESNEKSGQSKAELDDWEDAADISTPKLETSDKDGSVVMVTKYSRDFLLKFSDQFTDLPEGFRVTSDIAEAMIFSNVNVARESYPSPGRNFDGPTGVPRLDRRGSGLGEEDKWNRQGHLASGNMRPDVGYGQGNVLGIRPVQGGNYGVLRNPRAQTPVSYAGGILSGPMQSMGPLGGMHRNTSDSDRWQRAKGIIPSPQTPLQVMHKAERKYEVGKITDEEQAKQRQLKGILNKLTPQNFEKLFEQVKQVNIDNAGTLTGVISQIFDKALMEPTFCEMYANFCFHLAGELPDVYEDNEKITFKRLLLNKCQEEFERGEREQEEANRAEEEGEVKQTEGEREEKRIQARRRMLGNIRLIGELYKKKMLTERIMHECIKKLLGQYQTPDEEDVEALCKLMSTIGEMIDHPKAKEHMDAYFDRMANLSNNMKLSSRVRFMLKDATDLRKNKWQQRRKVEGPKKIEEVHRDAAQERQAQASRLARGPSMNPSVRRGQPMDYAPRGSNMLSPNAQMGGYRGLPQQMRGFGNQDTRSDDRHSFDSRTVSVPLPQRPIGDDSITLGPQGGLARGMSIRGHPSMANAPLVDMSGPGDSRRMNPSLNGYSSLSERTHYGQREDHVTRYNPDRFVGPAYDQSSQQERNINYVNRDVRNVDCSFDRSSMPTSPPTPSRLPTLAQTAAPSEKVLPEEQLRDKSIETIKEFYSAKDEKEVALCIKDLNAPSFYPSMISLWITDSFERKDMERDLLAKLLINLVKPRDGMLTQDHLIKGFESVLATLEDTVTDAPRAGEFLGRIFAKILVENVIPMKEIERLIYEGGEYQGQLVEIGLAVEVLGVVLEIIESEKGEAVLKEMRSGLSLRLENFRPPGSQKSRRLDKFI